MMAPVIVTAFIVLLLVYNALLHRSSSMVLTLHSNMLNRSHKHYADSNRTMHGYGGNKTILNRSHRYYEDPTHNEPQFQQTKECSKKLDSDPLVMFGSTRRIIKENRCNASQIRSITIHAPNCNNECGGVRHQNALGKYDVEVFTDQAFHMASSSNAHCKLALLWEPPTISPHMYNTNAYNPLVLDAVFTVSEQMMMSNSSFFLRYLPPDSWVGTFPDPSPDAVLIPGKDAGISIILSSKKSAPGHRMRHEVWNNLLANKLPKVDGCGDGVGRRVANKTECLARYRFSIIIENNKDQGYYFSEKLVDCFLTATVPIVWGTGAKISENFDARGMIFWQTPSDLHKILTGRLDTQQKQAMEYDTMLHSVRCNYHRAKPLATMIFDRMTAYILVSYCDICHKMWSGSIGLQ